MRAGSICTGYGGLEQGLKMVLPNVELVWVADNDRAASILLAERYPGVPNLGNIKEIDWSTVEPVEILTAGIPCQPFSDAGQRRGHDDDRDLTSAFLECVRVLRPKLIILENVPGFRKRGFSRVLGGLASMGFHVRWHSVRASEAGASHRRERVFVLAYSSDDGQQRPWAAWLRRDGFENGSGQVVSNSPSDGWDKGGAKSTEQLGRPNAPEYRSEVVAHSNGVPGHGRQPDSWGQAFQRTPFAGSGDIDWREYEPAVRRWERIFGSLAPAPTELGPKGNARLSPYFVEWMMGIPKGWVTDVLVTRKDLFTKLGNGVVPLQAALAIRGLMYE